MQSAFVKICFITLIWEYVYKSTNGFGESEQLFFILVIRKQRKTIRVQWNYAIFADRVRGTYDMREVRQCNFQEYSGSGWYPECRHIVRTRHSHPWNKFTLLHHTGKNWKNWKTGSIEGIRRFKPILQCYCISFHVLQGSWFMISEDTYF